MVEVACGVPSHASCHDRPPGYVGGPLAPGWPRPGPGHRGFPAAHRHLHPDGRPPRGDHPAHQASEFRRVECCRVAMLLAGEKKKKNAPTASSAHNHAARQTLSNACFDRGGCCGRVGVFCLGPPPTLGSQTADDVICGRSQRSSGNMYLMQRLKETSSGLNFAISAPSSRTLPQPLIEST